MDSETTVEVEKIKKRKAKIIAGTITFFIFCVWIVYFVTNTKEQIKEDKPFALFADLKQNTMKPVNEIKGFFNEIKSRFSEVVDTSSEVQRESLK